MPQPQRMCASCRRHADKSFFLRVVRSADGAAVFDPTQVMPGRGAYLCPEETCLNRARKTSLLNRHLSIHTGDTIYDELQQYLRSRADGST